MSMKAQRQAPVEATAYSISSEVVGGAVASLALGSIAKHS